MHQGATPFFERPVTTGDPEAFVHGVRPSSVSNLSAQPPRFAMRSLVWPSEPRLLSWGDVVRSMVLEGTVWRPHSLHTAEARLGCPANQRVCAGRLVRSGLCPSQEFNGSGCRSICQLVGRLKEARSFR
jgi:hypothetical protein